MPILGAFMVPHPPMIVKEIGNGSENKIKKTIESYQTVAKEIAALKPDTIIISSPHTYLYYDHFYMIPGTEIEGNFQRFGHKEISFHKEVDKELTDEIEKLSKEEKIDIYSNDEKHQLDHGTMVPLYFIDQEYTNYKLIVIGLSGKPYIDHYKVGIIIKKAIEELGRNAVYIASGDLSHKLQDYGPYGFTEEGPIYDEKIMDIMGQADFNRLLTIDERLCKKAAECGHRSFIMMAGCLDGIELDTNKLSHEDITGVGYGICSYRPMGLSEERRFLKKYLEEEKTRIENQRKKADDYVKLAIEAIIESITNHKRLEKKNLPKELLEQRRGVFVTIHKFNRLRGCIGSIFPTQENIAQEIIGKAISAAQFDQRFKPVEEDEIPYLEVHVDILSPLERVSSIEELDVKKYGIVVSCDFRRGVLLPDLDNVETIEDQIKIALEKGNINDNEEFTIDRFTVERHT